MAAFNGVFPGMPMPSFPTMMGQNASKLPFYGGLPVFPGMPIGAFDEMMKAQSFVPPPKRQGNLHSQSELDMLLYGYTKSKTPGYSHALSGLTVSDIKSDKANKSSATKNHNTVVEDDSLPEGVIIQQLTFAGIQHPSVFTTRTFAKGHMFGPFQGKNVYASEIKTNDGNSSMWEIFKDGKLKYFIDGRGSSGNWMSYVNCARYSQEQNLNAVQVGEEIFYQASKDITEGKELLVWYGDTYNTFMGIPVGLKVDPEDSGLKEETTSGQTFADDSNGYSCERCGKVFAYKYYKDKHLKYTRCVDQGNRKFPCTLCSRSFEKRDRLRIHILHVHEKHRPHKCTVCNKCFSQSSSLNKHMRVHSGERPYKCVYCNKAFTASSILRTHIRQHSGEKPFKCKFCGKAFASHAAHDSHVRRTHAKEKESATANALSCKVCQVTFNQPMELTAHMKSQHQGALLLDCNTCGYLFSSQYDLYTHSTRCLASPEHAVCNTSLDSVMTDEECFTGQLAGKDEIDVVG